MIEKREEVREEKQVVNLTPGFNRKIEKLGESGLRDRLKKILATSSWLYHSNKRTKKIIKRSDCAMVTLNGKSLETLNGDRHCHATGSRRKNSGGQFNHAYVALLL